MQTLTRTLAVASLLVASALPVAPAAHAQADYPARPIKLILPFPPGGGADLTARSLAQKMGESMGQSIVVENKPGASGSIGTGDVVRAARDRDPRRRAIGVHAAARDDEGTGHRHADHELDAVEHGTISVAS